MSGHLPHEAYEPIADAYASARDDPPLRKRIRRQFHDALQGTRVLEVGCGPGHDAAALAAAGLDVTAVDLCKAFVAYGRETYPSVEFHCRNLLSLGFPEASFDGVLGLACFCHLQETDLQMALASIRSCLTPGGLLLIWLMDSPSVASYRVEDWGGVAENSIEMICHDRVRMHDQLGNAGFIDMEVTGVESDYYAKIPRIRNNKIQQYLVQARLPLI